MSALLVCSASRVVAESCAVRALAGFRSLLGRGLTAQEVRHIEVGFPKEVASMLEIKQAAARVGLDLVGVRASVEQLRQVAGPKILHLKDPDHFLVLIRTSSDWAQIMESGQVAILSLKDVEQRYTGHALIRAPPERLGGPKMDLPEFCHSFGVVSVGQELEREFTIGNIGNEDLAVRQRGACCGAPQVLPSESVVRPGESAVYRVGCRITQPGETTASVELLTNDPHQPVVYLALHALAPPTMGVHPEQVRIVGEKDRAVSALVMLRGPGEMTLRSVACERGLFQAHTGEAETVPGGRLWRITVKLQPDHQVGRFEDRLNIGVADGNEHVITVPLLANISADLEVVPGDIFFGLVRLGPDLRQEVMLRSRSKARFAVHGVTCAHPSVRVSAPRATWRPLLLRGAPGRRRTGGD